MIFFRRENRFVLDSSSIIDGRVIHLFERKFFEGRVVIPYMVKTIVRRSLGNKGERAINILKRNASVEFVHERENGLVEEVCVLKIARKRHAKVFTVSDEVCRHSKFFPQVNIIDIRDLHRVLTPIFSPEKSVTVKILKRGLNPNEGVGYIEGMKVIVENGAKHLNKTITARVTTMLSLETGSLVFCSLDEQSNTNNVNQSGKKGKGS